jgi:tRNA nucleotidyltransferase (CCA-adding enzyme)
MKTYLVGGAVRDELLGMPVRERDWVVVGETPESMLERGFRQVGKDFPVFLHPETAEEYALARREYKQGTGHKGFKFDVSLDISLEEDLQRRDLTINAIAKNANDELIDPHDGQQDIAQRILRHVSNAFFEDPLRVLRLAQFAARLAHLGFSIAPETLNLCQTMVESGELSSLSNARVFKELEKGLKAPRPSRFFEVLDQVSAVDIVLPGLDIETTSVLDTFALIYEPAELFAVLCSKNPRVSLKNAAKTLALPKAWLELSQLTREYSSPLAHIEDLNSEQVLDIFEACDARRKPARFKTLCQIASDAHAFEQDRKRHLNRVWRRLVDALGAVTFNGDPSKTEGFNIKAQIRARRLQAIDQVLNLD